jgi:long-chain acyl-CoA synthetase
LIPRFVQEILDHPQINNYDITSVVACNTGGASIREDLAKRLMEVTKAPFYQGYGLTEAGPVTHGSPVEGPSNLASAGLAYPDTEAKIVDMQIGEVEMSVGEPGELILRGPQIMKGYWKSPEETQRVLRKEWLYTGDIASIDEDGWLYIVGRKRERIVADGHTVYPSEVEDILLSDPIVERAIVVGAPDPLRCDTDVQAFVVLRGGVGRRGVEESLLRMCRERLDPFKVPARIEVVEELPLTPMGKVDRLAVEVEMERRIRQQTDERLKKQRS